MPRIAAVAPAVQSWGAFKRALDLDPAHGLSLQNRRDLTGFLSHTSGWQVHAGGGHARADSTVKMITHGAALLGPQGHDHPLGCRHLHLLGDAPQRHRGPHLGASSSVWRSSRRGLACSSTSSSTDESFCTCLKHTWNLMMLCSLMCRAELLTQQPLLSGAVVFGACVCGRVTTRLVQTCAVTIREPVRSTIRP